MTINKEKLHAQFLEDIATSKAKIEKLKEFDLIDEDGYPTDEALEIVKSWHWSDTKGWFDFIKSIWWHADWGWLEKDEPHAYNKDETVHNLYISTGGWSGNESIIRAMQESDFMWHLVWVQSRRGGHYIFELKEFNE